jgi:chromosome segregation ATPase
MGSDLRRHQELAADLDRRIAEEEAKLSRDIEAERAPLRLAIEKATDDITKIDIQVTRMTEELDKATDEYRTHSDEYNEIKSSIRNAENAKQQAIGRMNNIRAAARDKLMKYGNGMPQLVQAIKGERGWRGRVIGPMGLHVKLNHGEYAKTLDSFFNHYLNGFVCEDHEDTRRLRAMMKRFNL